MTKKEIIKEIEDIIKRKEPEFAAESIYSIFEMEGYHLSLGQKSLTEGQAKNRVAAVFGKKYGLLIPMVCLRILDLIRDMRSIEGVRFADDLEPVQVDQTQHVNRTELNTDLRDKIATCLVSSLSPPWNKSVEIIDIFKQNGWGPRQQDDPTILHKKGLAVMQSEVEELIYDNLPQRCKLSHDEIKSFINRIISFFEMENYRIAKDEQQKSCDDICKLAVDAVETALQSKNERLWKPVEEIVNKLITAWGADHLNSAHTSMDVKYSKLYDLIIGVSKEVGDLRIAVKNLQNRINNTKNGFNEKGINE